jgi:hypothetical protein
MTEPDEFNILGMIIISLTKRRSYAGELQMIDNEGSLYFHCKLNLTRKGMIVGRAETRTGLKKNLTEMCIMHLDRNIHTTETFTVDVMNSKIFIN